MRRHVRGPSVDSSQFAVPDDDESLDGGESVSSYAGSGESVTNETFNPVDFLSDAFSSAFDPSKLDRAVANQAQTSGLINSKAHEVETLRAESAARLAEIRTIFNQGIKDVRRVQKDLEYIHRMTKHLQQVAKKRYPVEFQQAIDMHREQK